MMRTLDSTFIAYRSFVLSSRTMKTSPNEPFPSKRRGVKSSGPILYCLIDKEDLVCLGGPPLSSDISDEFISIVSLS